MRTESVAAHLWTSFTQAWARAARMVDIFGPRRRDWRRIAMVWGVAIVVAVSLVLWLTGDVMSPTRISYVTAKLMVSTTCQAWSRASMWRQGHT